MNLIGKNVIITGGSQGLGKKIVKTFLTHKANVSFCSRSQKDIDQTLNTFRDTLDNNQKLVAITCDISCKSEVKDFHNYTKKELGSIDVLINNAGIYGPMGDSEEVNIDKWWDAIAINLKGAFLMCRAVIPEMKKRKKGKIIVISGGGASAPMPKFSAYAASKAGLARLTETLAEELKDFNIDINSIAPGALNTRMMQQVIDAGKEVVGENFFKKNQNWKKTGATPLELGAKLCLYLASEKSNGITGKLISAQWDPWKNMHNFIDDLKESDIYTLRRITPRDRDKTWGQEDL